MSLLDFLKPKKALDEHQESELKKLEKAVGSTNAPNIPATQRYIAVIKKLKSEGYNLSKHQNTIEVYEAILKEREVE